MFANKLFKMEQKNTKYKNHDITKNNKHTSKHTDVCEINTPPENNAIRNIGFRSKTSGAGWQFLLKDCKARARLKRVSAFRDTGRYICMCVYIYIYIYASLSLSIYIYIYV